MATYTSTLEESIYLSTYLLIDLRGNGHPPDYLGGNATCTHLFKSGWSSIYLSKEGWPPILSIYLSREGWLPIHQSRGEDHFDRLFIYLSISLPNYLLIYPTQLPIQEGMTTSTNLFRRGWSPIYLSKEGWPPILSIYLSREGWPPILSIYLSGEGFPSILSIDLSREGWQFIYQSKIGWTYPFIFQENIYLTTHLPILEEMTNSTHLFRRGWPPIYSYYKEG